MTDILASNNAPPERQGRRSREPAFLELNILPERYRRRRITLRVLAPWFSLLILIGLLVPSLQQSMQTRDLLAELEDQYARLQAELASYTPLIEEVETLEAGIARAETRAQAFENVYQNVQIQSIVWNQRFFEILDAQPAGLSIDSISLDELGVTIDGFAEAYGQPLDLVARLAKNHFYQRMYVEEIAYLDPSTPDLPDEGEPGAQTEGEEATAESPLPPYAFQIRLPLAGAEATP